MQVVLKMATDRRLCANCAGSSQVVRICVGKMAFSCLEKVNKTQLSHLISHNLEGPFRDSLYK